MTSIIHIHLIWHTLYEFVIHINELQASLRKKQRHEN